MVYIYKIKIFLKFTITLIIFFNFKPIFSQSKEDSLIKLSENETNERIQANLYLQISEKLERTDTSKCFEYIKKGIGISKKNNWNNLLAQLYYTKAHAYDGAGEYIKAIDIYKTCINYAKKVDNVLLLTKSHLNIGATQYYYGQQNNALKNYKKSLEYSILLNDSSIIAKNYNNIALIYKSKGKYVDAIVNFHKSLNINSKFGNKKSVANTYMNIGSIYWEQDNYKDAKKNYNKSAIIYQELNDKIGLAGIYTNLGLICKTEKDTLSALKHYKNAVLLYKQSNFKFGLSTAYMNIGVVYDEKKDLKKAIKYYHKSLNLSKKFPNKKVALTNLLNLSSIYAFQKKHKKAEQFAKQGLAIAKEMNDLISIYNAHKILATNYSYEGRFNLAYNNIKIYTALKDSLFNLEKNKQLNEIRTKYETEKKEAEILLFKEKDKIQNIKIEKDNQIIWRTTIILIITILSLIIFFILFIQKRKSYIALVERNIQLTKQDIEKEKEFKKNIKQDIGINRKTEKQQNVKDNNLSNNKYQKSILSDIQKQELLQNIISLMEEEKYFLNPHFTIDEFSKEINTNRGYISQIINEFFKTNFNNFINEYRVKETRKLLIDSNFDNYSLEGIASLAGFNNRVTFNTAFKKFTGVTPSFFKKNSRESL